MIPAPQPRDRGMATSADGSRIAWYRHGDGQPTILIIPTWNIVDARVVGHQVEALAQHATVVTYDPRGAGASDRPARGYGFDLHEADALAVMEATGITHAAVLTASRSLNAAVLLATDHPERVERIAAVAPYMVLDADPSTREPVPADHPWRSDWAGWIDPFMHRVFTEPDSEALIAEMISIGMDASPDAVLTQEMELDWAVPAARLGSLTCPTLIVHGDADAAVPMSLVRGIVDAIPEARLEVIGGGGHRPDIRTPERVNPLLLDFLLPQRTPRV